MIFLILLLLSVLSFFIFRQANKIFNEHSKDGIISVQLAIGFSIFPVVNIIFSICALLASYSVVPNNNFQKFRNWFEGP